MSIIIYNIINNSIYALNKQKTKTDKKIIIVSTKYNEKDETLIISIEDNGPGIRNEIKDRIFDLNFSTKSKSEYNTKKTHGIGLYFVYNSLKGGDKGDHIKLDFDSVLNKYTKFTIEIPEYTNFL